MIEASVDRHAIDPAMLQMLHQKDPFPGGSRYILRITDAELVEVVSQDYDETIDLRLVARQTASLFNMLRKMSGDMLKVRGVCSPYVE
jgi:hypothetical protein